MVTDMKDYKKYDYGVRAVWKASFSNDSVSAFGRVYKGEYFEKMNQACHGGLSSSLDKVDLEYIVSRIQPWKRDEHCKSPEATRAYINWLVNDSPYAIGHAVKDVDWILKNKAFIGNIEAPAILMAPALVAARRVHEMPLISYLTGNLIIAGVNGNLAYLIAHNITSLSTDGKFYWGNAGREHTTVDPSYMYKKAVLNWVNDERVLSSEKSKPYKESQNYYGYTELWVGRGGSKGSSQWLLDFLRLYKFKEVGDTSVVNPFAASVVVKGGEGPAMSFSDLIEGAKELEQSIMKELGE